MNNKKNEVQKHIEEKFQKFATTHGLTLIGTPGLCEVRIFSSDKKTQHTAAQAIGYASADRKRVEGWIINVADKKLRFFANTEAHCLAVTRGKVTAGKNEKRKKAVMAGKDGAGVSFQSLG